jgi:hypothetical protein
MKISILEIFFVFWISALLWIMVEYFYYRISKNTKGKSWSDHQQRGQ